MYGAKGTTFLNTVARQSALSKQLATVHASNKTSAFITAFPARSGKLYTTSRTLNNNDNNNNNKDQQQQHLNGNPFAPLARASNQRWTSGSSTSLQPKPVQQQLRFKSALAQQQPTQSTLEASPELLEEPNARILELAKHKNYGAVVAEFQATKTQHTPLTTQTYQAVMESYGTLHQKNQPLTAMLGVFDEMVKHGVQPTSETYAIVIRNLCARDAEVNRASNVLRRQMDTNLAKFEGVSQQTSSTVGSLHKDGSSLHALESEKNLQRAVAIFEQAVQEKSTQAFDVELYNNLLRGLSYVGNTQDGLFIYEQLENDRVRPNGTTFAMLMSMFGTAGDLTAVRECFKEYKSMSRILPTHDPSYVYNALVFAHVNAGDLNGALRVVEQTMIKDGVPVTISPYNRMLYRACMDNNMEFVSKLLEKLSTSEHLPKPDANTYGLLLSTYSRMKDLDKAHDAFENLLKLNLRRQYGHLSEYVNACVNEQQYNRALETVRAMSSHGVELDTKVCCNVVSGYVKLGDMKQAADVVKEVLRMHSKTTFIRQNSPLVALALEIAGRSDNLVDALDILRFLNNYSVRSTPQTSAVLLQLYDQAKANPTTWQEFVNYCTDRSFFTLYEAAFKRKSTSEDFCNSVFTLLNDMHALNMNSNPSLYIRVSTRLNKYGRVEDEARWKKTFEEYYPNIQEQIDQAPSTTTTSSSSATPALSSASSVSSESTVSKFPFDSTKVDILSGEALNMALRGDFDKALDMMKEKIINQGMVPTPETVRDMIQHANKLNQLDTSKAIYNLVEQPFRQMDPSRRQHALNILNNNMLIAYARNMDLGMAKVYYDKLRAANAFPDADAYGCLLSCTANDTTDESLDAMVIYEEAKRHKVRPTVYFYNVIISKLAKCRKMDQVMALFKEMKDLGVSPNSITYAGVISACIRCSAESRAVYYFEEMTRLPRYQPRIGVFNSMIQFYVQQRNDRDKALEYFQLLKQSNLTPSAHTYKLLIEAYANIPAFDMVTAHNLLTEMKKRYGLDPTATHYATLMKSYGCLHRDVTSAEAVYKEMTKAGVKPNELVYQALLDTYINNNKMTQAENLYKDMTDANVQSSPYIENLFIKGYGANGEVNKAEEVFNKMKDNQQSENNNNVIREPSTYEAMVKVYMDHDQVTKAKEVVNMMKQRDFPIKVVDSVLLLTEDTTS
ncbi:uncharacterized protein BX664DRAFT_326098 [Halteromyces radiatus]|uniref:uncharacterized protein n=1 Tax=Halteromyces radiatus TaxID=101107 RepID=UPI00222063B5|nr:uncharacterized protein BX664DRAFT_326098 [Halteromyces radiatus]KAI8097313.1 hypothetical protein BX664DRAFT_326098 [Halteromyces radiatus]